MIQIIINKSFIGKMDTYIENIGLMENPIKEEFIYIHFKKRKFE